MSKEFLLEFDSNQHAVLNPDFEKLPYHFHEKLLYAFVTDKNIQDFLKDYPHKKLGKFVTVSFNPYVYEVKINNCEFTLCQAPAGASVAVKLLDWLINYGVKEVLAVGSAGAITELPENEIFLVKKALRDEGTSYHYLDGNNIVNLNSNFTDKIQMALKNLNYNVKPVMTWTTDGFFRETESKLIKARKLGCQLVEMECSALAACSKFRNVKFGQILFTADSLADTDNYDKRGWGKSFRRTSLDIGIKVLVKINEFEN